MSSEIAARGQDFPILNDAGENAFLISGRSISEDDTIRIESMGGQVLYEATAHFPRKRQQIVIVDGTGVQRGSVERISVSPLRDRFTIELEDGLLLAVEGNVPKHEFSIGGPEGVIAEISQKWFRARGSYGVEITPDQRDALLLTTIVVLDQMIQGSG
jgi:uncharacterized protein YxjI